MISKYSVKRPYTVLVAVVLVIVLGAVSLSKMTTDLLPDMSFQYALVITTDMGASPEQVESDVTSPIESAMATTSNIKNISSVSYNSYSVVTLEYEQNANMDSVVIEIQQSLDQVSGQWDDSIGTPMIMKVNPDIGCCVVLFCFFFFFFSHFRIPDQDSAEFRSPPNPYLHSAHIPVLRRNNCYRKQN